MTIVSENPCADSPPIERSDVFSQSTYEHWDGQELGPVISIDTETELVSPLTVPRLALASVCDGQRTYIIHPQDTDRFLTAHVDAQFVGFNVAFDFWVLIRACTVATGEILWSTVAQGRYHDAMILDQLIRLARDGRSDLSPRSLDKVAAEYSIAQLDKSDPHRLRYGELIGRDFSQVEAGFFEYATADARVTLLLFRELQQVAQTLYPTGFREGLETYGLLTETLQVRSAIALADVQRRGIGVDANRGAQLADELRLEIEESTNEFISCPECGQYIRRDKAGQIAWTATGRPRWAEKPWRRHLEAVDQTSELNIPRTEKGHISLKADDWLPHLTAAPEIPIWLKILRSAKLRQFVIGLTTNRLYPKYTNLLVTGRTSSSAPNIQQVPREGDLRSIFEPTPEHYLLSIDYVAVELVALGADMQFRYGESVLASVLNDGIDPHAYTAANFAGLSLEEFAELKADDPDRFNELRQKAKVINFGIPGGLGAQRLSDYAKSDYGIDLSLDEAEKFRSSLINKTYPELQRYLTEDARATICDAIECDPDDFNDTFSDTDAGAMRRILQGLPRRDGHSYGEYGNGIWRNLDRLNRNRQLTKLIRQRDTSGLLSDAISRRDVWTISGRRRGKATYTQARNTPFQGLAADGAKLALWELVKRDYRVVAFIHDEFLIELPADADHTREAQVIERILCDAMSQFARGVRVRCKYALMARWHKDAVAVFEDGRLVPWQPLA